MEKQASIPGPDWIPTFLETLKRTGIVGTATAATGKAVGTIYFQRRRNLAFARAWDAALREATPALPDMAPAATPQAVRPGTIAPVAAGPRRKNTAWQPDFLAKLAETSNVSAAAEHANIPLPTVYAARRKQPGFADGWRAALFEGYLNLEMEVLGFLRDPAPTRKMDVANALRLLAAHKDLIAREGAHRANVSAAQIRASIERRVQKLREQVAAQRERDETCESE